MNKKKLVLALRLIVSGAILIYLITVLDWQRLFYVFSHLRLEYVWFTPILVVLALYCLAIRWTILLTYFRVRLSKKESFLYYLVGNFYNVILPGAIGGDVIRIGICAVKKKQPVTLIATSVLLERIFGLLVVFFLGAIGILLLSAKLRQQLGATLTTAMLLLSLVTLFIFSLSWFLLRFIPLVSIKSKAKKIPIVLKLLNILDRLRQIPPKALLGIFIFNIFSQVFDIIASYFLAKSILLELPLIVFFVVIPIVYISTVLPISLGGLGVREGVLALLLSRMGIPSADAITFSFVLYLNRVFVSLIGGIVQIFWHLPTKTILTPKSKK